MIYAATHLRHFFPHSCCFLHATGLYRIYNAVNGLPSIFELTSLYHIGEVAPVILITGVTTYNFGTGLTLIHNNIGTRGSLRGLEIHDNVNLSGDDLQIYITNKDSDGHNVGIYLNSSIVSGLPYTYVLDFDHVTIDMTVAGAENRGIALLRENENLSMTGTGNFNMTIKEAENKTSDNTVGILNYGGDAIFSYDQMNINVSSSGLATGISSFFAGETKLSADAIQLVTGTTTNTGSARGIYAALTQDISLLATSSIDIFTQGSNYATYGILTYDSSVKLDAPEIRILNTAMSGATDSGTAVHAWGSPNSHVE